MTTAVIRVELPYHLQNLARVGAEVSLEVPFPITAAAILDTLEARYPMLCGTIRDHVTKQRRPFLRYFACQQDLSHDPTDTPLPKAVVSGVEPFIIWGALAGG
ncbi:MAG: MoaD/ThiS family protein [Planctomycetaceae bacterium]